MSRKHVVPFLLASLAGACVADDAELSTEIAASASAPRIYRIQALGNRCVDTTFDRTAGLTIRTCAPASTSQQFRAIELTSRDLQLVSIATGLCVAVEGPGVGVGRRLIQEPCAPTAAQRFAWDGDALLVGRQLDGERVSRDFAIEYRDAVTTDGTPVVVGARDVDDAEFWRFIPVPGFLGTPGPPHGGFVTVGNEEGVAWALANATWGSVIVVEGEALIPMDEIAMDQVVRAGVTLRGGRKFTSNGAGLDIPDERALPPDSWFLRTEDHARITGIRIEGNGQGRREESVSWGILAGGVPGGDPAWLTDVIIDHVDVSHWSDTAIAVWGPHDDAGRFECPAERGGGLPVKIVGNFIHHSNRRYGVMLGAGGAAFLRGNLMFLQAHDVTASFNGYNRYLAVDGLFTGQTDDHVSAIFDVHGSCSVDGSHWQGGIAGDSFEAGWMSFLTDRGPMLSIRGTPCDHYELHDSVSVQRDEGEDAIEIHKGPYDDTVEDCRAKDDPFTPGADGDILWTYGNTFGADNPLRGCFGGRGSTCGLGDLAVGDFDGDKREDLFFGTGATWWFSSGGTAEWRLLNRMPELASQLRFGDFDLDGRTDVVAVHGRDIEISWAGASRWFPLNAVTSAIDVADLAVANVGGDGRADLFLSDGERWQWASHGGDPWAFYAFSGYRVPDLRFGNFVGDAHDDVFGVTGGRWQVVRGPGESWESINDDLVEDIDELVVANFDGGKDDLAWHHVPWWPLSSSTWRFSSGGADGEVELRETEQRIVGRPIGRFDADGEDDVLLWHGSGDRWFELASAGVDVEPWSRQSMR